MNAFIRFQGGCVLPLFLSVGALFAADDPFESVEKGAEAWVQSRVEVSRLETSWLAERAILQSTLAAYKDRASALKEKHELTLAKTAKEREEIMALQSKAKDGQTELRSFESRLKTVNTSLVQLRPFLPPRLSSGLEMAFRSLADEELPVGERMQLSITVLNRCAQFNRTITSGEEILRLNAAESAKAVQVIYWGLSHGYALDSLSGQAWLGSPGTEGWRWEPAPGASQAVAQLIAVYNDKADPSFVRVPAKLSHTRPESSTN